MIPTMISLDAYETLPVRGGTSHEGWAALRGTIGREIDYGRTIWNCRRNQAG